MRFRPLSAADRRHFEERGFLIVRRALSPTTIATLIAVGDRLVASDQQRGRQRQDGGRYDGFRHCIALDPVFLPLLTNERTLPAVLQLMSPNLQLHTSHLIWKLPDDPDAGPRRSPGWHRDINTCPADLGHAAVPRLEIKVAYQLSDASRPGCGQTLVAPGSHLLRTPLELGPDGDPSDVIEPLLHPGDALLFENRTWHAGGHNRSGQVRKNIMFGYSYRWMRPDDWLLPDDELLQRADPIQRQLLGGTGGLFDEAGRFRHGGTVRPLDDWCRQHGVEAAWRHQTDLHTGDG